MMVKFKVKRHIKDRDWSIAEFARQTGLSYPTAHAIYHGKAKQIDMAVLSRILDVLNIDIADALEYIKEEAPTLH